MIIRKLDKADGTPRGYRFVVDLRSRNETVRDIGNQLPEAATLFDYLCVSKVVSVYDVKDGYWNCPFAADPGRGEGGGRAKLSEARFKASRAAEAALSYFHR